MINSVKSQAVVEAAVTAARELGVAIYGAATPAISVEARIELLLSNCRLTQFNLAEFKELTGALGVACPVVEEECAIEGIAKAIAKLCEIRLCRDLAVTMGETGMVLLDSAVGQIAHIGMTDAARAQTRRHLRATQICGIGDETFSALVLACESCPDTEPGSRLVRSARRAWADVLRGKSQFLKPRDTWFTVRQIADGLAPRASHTPAPSGCAAAYGPINAR